MSRGVATLPRWEGAMKRLGVDQRAREINGFPGSDRLLQPQSFDVVDQQSAMSGGFSASLRDLQSYLEPRRSHFAPVGRCNEMLGG